MTHPLMKPRVKSNIIRLERVIREAIESNPSISHDLLQKDISTIEKEIGIQAHPPRVYLGWEKGNKEGWQYGTFVSEKEYSRRENLISQELKDGIRYHSS